MTAVKGGTGKVTASHRDDDVAGWKAKCAALQAELLKHSLGSPPPPTTPPPRKAVFTPSPVPPTPKADSQQAAPLASSSAVPAAKAPALSGPPLPPGLPAVAAKTAPTAPPARLPMSKAAPSASPSLASSASKEDNLPAEDAEGPHPGEEVLVEKFDLESKDRLFYM